MKINFMYVDAMNNVGPYNLGREIWEILPVY